MYKVTLTKMIFQKGNPHLMNTVKKEIELSFAPFIGCVMYTEGSGNNPFIDKIEDVSYFVEFGTFLAHLSNSIFENAESYSAEKEERQAAGWVLSDRDIEIDSDSSWGQSIEKLK